MMGGPTEISHALEACEQQRFDVAEHLLRWGDLQSVAPPALTPNDRWLRLERAPKFVEGSTNDDLTAAYAGLAASGTGVQFLIVADGVYVSLAATDAESWFRRILAPRFTFADDQPRLDQRAGAHAVGVRLIATPPIRQEEHLQLRHASQWVPLIERLLSNRGPGWGVIMEFEPTPPAALASLLGEVSNGLRTLALHRSTKLQQDEVVSLEIVNPTVERVIEQLSTHRSLLDRARLLGGWGARIYAVAEGPEQAAAITAGFGAPMRPSADGDWATNRVGVESGAPTLDALGTLSSADLADLVAPPRSGSGRIRISHPLPAGEAVPPAAGHTTPLSIATQLGSDDPVQFSVDDLAGHGFICGITGSGKSSTVLQILLGLWNANDIPFLVVDPVKADYENYAGLFKGGLSCIDARELASNVLQPWSGTEPDVHIGMVINAFRGSFSMPTPIPYVLSRLLEATKDDLLAGFQPTLHDLRSDLDGLVTKLGYAPEIESNIRAALGTRLDLLLDPLRAERVAGPDLSMLAGALERPTVIQLASVADEEERAFLMTMIATFIAQAARRRGPQADVRHVTVLEEAHRIMPEPRHGADSEAGDATSNAAEQLGALLAEIRSYGEAVLVLDQSPNAVAREVVRNTNLKILHRVVDPADREIAGGAVGLRDDEADCLLTLMPGEAVSSSRRSPEPQSVSFNAPPPTKPLDPVPAMAPRRSCCSDPARHHRAERLADQVEDWLQLQLVALMVEPERAAPTTDHLRNLARAESVSDACLWDIGLRRLVRVYHHVAAVDASNSNSAQRAGSEDGPGRLVGLAERLRPALVDRPGPFEACTDCPNPCVARMAVERGLGGRTNRLARMLMPTSTGDATKAQIAGWIDLVRPGLLSTVGSRAGRTLTHCAIVHRLASDGYGSATRLQDLGSTTNQDGEARSDRHARS